MSKENEQKPPDPEQKPPDPEEKKKEPETAELGDGLVFIGRDSQGAVRTVKADVFLIEGTHYNKISGKAQINSAGCAKLNQVANINLIKPQNTIVNGEERHNPYVEIDPHSKGTAVVYTRTLGIGFAPTGNLVLTDKSLVFNLDTYYKQDLQAKIKKCPSCGTMGRKNRPPDKWKGVEITWKTSQSGKRYPEENPIEVELSDDADLVFIETRRVGETILGMWVDITHPEIIAAGNDDIQRQKFADRQAETICSRNVLKSHPAIAMNDISNKLVLDSEGKETGYAKVRVYGYKHDMGLKEIRSLTDAAQEGDLDKATEIAGASFEVVRDEKPEEANFEEVTEVAEEIAAEEATDEAAKKKQKEEKPKGKSSGKKKDKPAGGSGEASYTDKLAVAAHGPVNPQEIANLANNMGYKVTLYTELTEKQAEAVYHKLEQLGDV